MSGLIPEEIIERIRGGTDIVDLVGETVKLKKKGSEFYGRCPFHDENTPSFYVIPDRQFYHCFGCGESGDIFKWVADVQRMKFPEAVQFLGGRCGVPVANGKAGEDFDSTAWKKSRREIRERAREVERERDISQANAAHKAQARWDAAAPATADHPYLKKKKVTAPYGLRVERDLLLVPMRGLEAGAPLVSLQSIAPNGSKRFMTDSRVKNTRASIGARYMARNDDGSVDVEQEGVLYICEGWATGWAISRATKRPVIVAFTANNLKDVARHARKAYANMTLVVAADNDRWKRVKRKGRKMGHNPGVTIAKEAARSAKALVAAPDFEDLADKPTDFNDLYVSEGEDAVRVWLDPDNMSECRTRLDLIRRAEEIDAVSDPQEELPQPAVDPGPEPESEPEPQPEPEPDRPAPEPAPESAEEGQVVGSIAPPEPAEPQPEEIGEAPETWLDTKPFRLLGHNHGSFYYITKAGGQIVSLSPGRHERSAELYALAPHSWWEHHFPGKNGINQKIAADALIQASYRQGVFRGDNVRGRGCWQDETEDGDEGLVLHLGDRMVVPGAKTYVSPEEYESHGGYMYEAQQRLKGPAKKAMGLDESREILDIFRSLLWSESVSGDMLAGWTVLAPVCGSLWWRPHVWMCGERGGGKSTIATDMVVPLLGGGSSEVGGMGLYVQGESTEAGMRQHLRADAFPVEFDEAEEGEGVGTRIQKILALARQSSTESDARTLKGTVHGSSLQFRVRSMFCFASISGAVYQESDKSRICMLQLKGKSQVTADERLEHWSKLKPRLFAITSEAGRRLLTRTVTMLRDGRLAQTVDTFRKAGGVVFGDQRMGDQYGTLLAGAWMLHSDDVPDEAEAREMVGSEELDTYQSEQVAEGKKALQIMLQQRERVDTTNGVKTVAVGELIDVCCGRGSIVSDGEANAVLRQLGMKVDLFDGRWILFVAPVSEWLSKTLANTMYARGVQVVLRGLDGVTMTDRAIRFHAGMACRALRVPVDLLETEDE